MQYLFDSWHSLKGLFDNKYIILFLDFDGTLAPIVETPEKAAIPARTKALLKELTKNPRCRLAVISGRSLKDVRSKVGLENLIYVGNHGLELKGPKIKFKNHIPSGYRVVLKKIKNDLAKRLSLIKGIVLEDKGLSLSVHYRLVEKGQIPEVKTIFHETIISFLAKNQIKVKGGKMVEEIRPPIEWDKGKIVLWLLSRQQFASKKREVLPIYIGDDLTDEDAFKILKNKGLTIFVGAPRDSYAQYYLEDTEDVFHFLGKIRSLLK